MRSGDVSRLARARCRSRVFSAAFSDAAPGEASCADAGADTNDPARTTMATPSANLRNLFPPPVLTKRAAIVGGRYSCFNPSEDRLPSGVIRLRYLLCLMCPGPARWARDRSV